MQRCWPRTPAKFRGVGAELGLTRFHFDVIIIRSIFFRVRDRLRHLFRYVTDCDICYMVSFALVIGRAQRGIPACAEEVIGGLDTVPPPCWVTSAARRVSNRVERKWWPGRCPATLLGRPTRKCPGSCEQNEKRQLALKNIWYLVRDNTIAGMGVLASKRTRRP